MTKKATDLSVIGAGYVGLTSAVAAALQGQRVHLVEVSPDRVAGIRRAEAPFYEPGLKEALGRVVKNGRLTIDTPEATQDLAAVAMICVGTPPLKTGADLTFLRGAAAWIGGRLRGSTAKCLVVVKSTVVPGTTEAVVAPALAHAAGRPVPVASNPEFLREGAALQDALHPDRIVVGSVSHKVAAPLWRLYSKVNCPKLDVDVPTAEAIKYAANAFLALKVGFSNEFANLCERVGVDWYRVAEGIGHDPRIGPLFLRAGAGFGGSCFPKDVAALQQAFRRSNVSSPILDGVLEGNARQPHVVVALAREELGSLKGKRIALLGLAFKPDTDDVRETRALLIHEGLVAAGARVVAHDPKATANFRKLVPGAEIASTAEAALEGADACVVQTEWAEYRRLAPAKIRRLLRSPIVIDGRRTFDPANMRRAGLRYRAIGLGTRPLSQDS